MRTAEKLGLAMELTGLALVVAAIGVTATSPAPAQIVALIDAPSIPAPALSALSRDG